MVEEDSKATHLKRARLVSQGEQGTGEAKRPRRSERISSQLQSKDDGVSMTANSQFLPSPVTHHNSTISTSTSASRPATVPKPNGKASGQKQTGKVEPGDLIKERPQGLETTPELQHEHLRQDTPVSSRSDRQQLPVGDAGQTLSPPSDTQPFSQFKDHHASQKTFSYEVDDEEKEGVWGYLLRLDDRKPDGIDTLVLRTRSACPMPQTQKNIKNDGKSIVAKKTFEEQENNYEQRKINGIAAGGYLLGRHPECDIVLNVPTISNRHCLIFHETKSGDAVAMLEDLSGNGTFVNESYVGRNKRRELAEGDEIAILDEARFIFRYPRSRNSHGFRQQYSVQQQLGKGHFATVYLCIERATGMRYAVKKFDKRGHISERSKVDGLEQEIAVLMGVSHPNVLCLKDTFDERDGVYLVLELAPEGELFNWIVMKTKLSEDETRKVFIQLFQGLKYLHERNIVHRDIKPENILLVDRSLSVKVADFGLAKIIGEESFTTTLCGTPSYVAPEILESSSHRRYTRAVDVWSLGVVLYICLCGFPPFSDELYSAENPYTLSQQIKLGRFDYPSPYWDPVSDAALDLIDRMLTVDVDKRITIDECLEHSWTTQRVINVHDSTDGLTGALDQLDFSKRKPQRERTLLSALNDIQVTQTVEIDPNSSPLKIFHKNEGQRVMSQQVTIGDDQHTPHEASHNKIDSTNKQDHGDFKARKEPRPGSERDPNEFIQLGAGPDQSLFPDADGGSRYAPEQA